MTSHHNSFLLFNFLSLSDFQKIFQNKYNTSGLIYSHKSDFNDISNATCCVFWPVKGCFTQPCLVWFPSEDTPHTSCGCWAYLKWKTYEKGKLYFYQEFTSVWVSTSVIDYIFIFCTLSSVFPDENGVKMLKKDYFYQLTACEAIVG